MGLITKIEDGLMNFFSVCDGEPKYPVVTMEIEKYTSDEDLLKNHGISLQKPSNTVTIKEPKFNVDAIIPYIGEAPKKFEFRPTQWNQFIGQTEAKERAQTIIKKVKQGIKSHFLVNGIKGHGKTTFIELLAKSMNAKLIERVGKQIDEESLVDIINEINTSTEEVIILFIDEIDSMDWKVVKVLNPIIESFKIAGRQIKPFIFAGATINKHLLIKNNPDTLDRIPTHITFTRYNVKELTTILKQYHAQLYGTIKVTEEAFESIAKNCKYNPRTAIALLEEYIVEKDINIILRNCNIIKDGLTKKDIELLQILEKATRAMGADALAMKCGLAKNEYLREYEPFLVEYDYINRVPSRIITDKGKTLLKSLS